nr:hypothetical protein [Tanacetum cinerariifolium]
MERLEEDEIFSIFERIPDPVDQISFSKVYKKSLKVACFHLQRVHNNFPDLLYDMLIACPRMLSFECSRPLSNNHMKLIAESCPNIKHLDLSTIIMRLLFNTIISDVGLEYLANGDLKYCLSTHCFRKCDRITDNCIIHLKKLLSNNTKFVPV